MFDGFYEKVCRKLFSKDIKYQERRMLHTIIINKKS